MRTLLGIVIVGGSLLVAGGCKKKDAAKGTDGSGSAAAKPVDGTGSSGAAKAPAGAATRKAVKVAAGDGFACAAMDNGTVRCWGRNDHGERGTEPSRDDAATPVEVPGVTDVVDLVAGGDGGASGDIACATTKAKAVWCWGGRGTIPNNKTKSEPRAIPELEGATSIALGGGTGYAVKPDGTVVGWGDSTFNTFGDNGPPNKTLPVTPIPGVGKSKQVVAGQNHGCALLEDGSVTCWGYSSKKQVATPVAGITGATYLYSQSQRENTCAVVADGVKCWSGSGEPRAYDNFKTATKIAGRNHECALLGDGSVFCTGSGDNTFGQIGTGDPKKSNGKVEGLAGKVVDISVGHVFACAIIEGGTVSCWGYNQRGQLGDGSLMDRQTPSKATALALDTLPPPSNGQDQTGEGPEGTKFDGMPAACKNGPIEVVSKNYEGKTFTVKSARAESQADGKTVSFQLADHNFQPSWGLPRGTQAELSFRLANVKIEGDEKTKKRTPVTVDPGEYKIGFDEERLVSPSLETKTGSSSLISISLTKGIQAGSLTVAHLDADWICGQLAIAADGTTVKGPFAAPFAKKM